MGTLAVIVVSLFYKQLTWKKLGRALVESTKTSAMILLLIMGARYFSYFITTTELAQTLSDADRQRRSQPLPGDPRGVHPVDHPRHAHGHLVGDDHHAAALLRHPHRQLAFDPLQLGVIVVLCIMLGCITPPVGVVVFSLAGMHRDVPMYTIFKGVMPFIYAMVIFLLLIIFVPWISTWLPGLMTAAPL